MNANQMPYDYKSELIKQYKMKWKKLYKYIYKYKCNWINFKQKHKSKDK